MVAILIEQMELQVQRLLSYSVAYLNRHDKIEDLLAYVPSNVISYHLAKKPNQLIGEYDFDIWVP